MPKFKRVGLKSTKHPFNKHQDARSLEFSGYAATP